MKTHFERIQEEVNFLRDQRIDNIVNTRFFKWYGDVFCKTQIWENWKRIQHLALENAKITADEYQHNWLVCHEIKLFGG